MDTAPEALKALNEQLGTANGIVARLAAHGPDYPALVDLSLLLLYASAAARTAARLTLESSKQGQKTSRS